MPPVETSSTPCAGQRPGEFDQAGLVGNGKQRAGDAAGMSVMGEYPGLVSQPGRHLSFFVAVTKPLAAGGLR